MKNPAWAIKKQPVERGKREVQYPGLSPLVNCFMRKQVVLEERFFLFEISYFKSHAPVTTCSTVESTVTIQLP